jgi:hypothetical protein
VTGNQANANTPISCLVIGLATVIPFWFTAYVVYVGLPRIMAPAEAFTVAIIYGSVYLAFSAGSKWGLVSSGSTKVRPVTQMALAFVGLLAGFIAHFPTSPTGLSILIAGFMVLALWDLIHSQSGAVVFWYAKLRVWLTVFIVTPLMAMLLKIL